MEFTCLAAATAVRTDLGLLEDWSRPSRVEAWLTCTPKDIFRAASAQPVKEKITKENNEVCRPQNWSIFLRKEIPSKQKHE
jgi:hypothetical protein